MLGSLLVAGFAFSQDASLSLTGDLLMLAAVIVCGLGYAEGAALTRESGGWQVISWSLILALPFMVVASVLMMPVSFSGIGFPAWAALGYVSLFSMLIGFIFWYKGLARGGSPPSGSYSCCSRFWGWDCPPRCCMSGSVHLCCLSLWVSFCVLLLRGNMPAEC